MIIIIYIYKGSFHAGAHSALRLLRTFTFTMAKYTSITDAFSQADTTCSTRARSHTHTHTHIHTHTHNQSINQSITDQF